MWLEFTADDAFDSLAYEREIDEKRCFNAARTAAIILLLRAPRSHAIPNDVWLMIAREVMRDYKTNIHWNVYKRLKF